MQDLEIDCVEVSVPYEVLEWFVSVRKDGQEVWSNWVDYYAVDGETEIELADEMQREIDAFVSIPKIAELRVAAKHPFCEKSTIEWRHRDAWEEMRLCVE